MSRRAWQYASMYVVLNNKAVYASKVKVYGNEDFG